MSWKDRARAIGVGDTVAYSAAWLRSTGTYTGDLPQAKGKVIALNVKPDYTIAEIVWDREGVPGKVNVSNLVRVHERGHGA